MGVTLCFCHGHHQAALGPASGGAVDRGLRSHPTSSFVRSSCKMGTAPRAEGSWGGGICELPWSPQGHSWGQGHGSPHCPPGDTVSHKLAPPVAAPGFAPARATLTLSVLCAPRCPWAPRWTCRGRRGERPRPRRPAPWRPRARRTARRTGRAPWVSEPVAPTGCACACAPRIPGPNPRPPLARP